MAANGVGVVTQIALSGTGVTLVGGLYFVTLSLTGTSSVAITAAAKDIAGNDPTYTGSVTWTSYNDAPTGQAGRVASVSAGTVTARSVGQALIEAAVPAFDNNGANAVGAGMVFARCLVQVNP